MKILDTNAVNYIFKNNIEVEDVYYITPDLKEESEITEAVFNKKLSSKIKEISNEDFFNKPIYLEKYKDMLNKHSGRSFYNMTGFGDISILALLKSFEAESKNHIQECLFGVNNEVGVFTGDPPLIKKIEKEFGQKVKIYRNVDIK